MEFYISISNFNFINDFVSQTCHIDMIIDLTLHIAQHTQKFTGGLHTYISPSIYEKRLFSIVFSTPEFPYKVKIYLQ